MNCLVETSRDDTRFNPGCLPWRIVPDAAGSRIATIYNGAGGPIATVTANSARQLIEIAEMIESAFRSQDQLSETIRAHANMEQRLVQRSR